MRRLALLASLIALVTACGWLAPAGTVPDAPDADVPPPELEEPPPALINGVEGMVTTFCWKGGCADWFGHPAPATLPRVSAPFRIALPLPADEIEVTAVGGGPAGREIPLAVTDLVITDPLPEGTVAVKVGIYFAGGGDAFYYWAVDQQGQGGSSPSP